MTRTTKYQVAIQDFMKASGHATNVQIRAGLRARFPELSITTIHRCTARMVSRGELALAPATLDHVSRFDANVEMHDHFHCVSCDRLRDIHAPEHMIESLVEELGGCRISGSLLIQGSCSHCLKRQEAAS